MKKYKGLFIFILVVVGIFAISSILNDSNSVKEVPYSTMINQVEKGNVESIYVDNDKIYYKLKDTANEFDGYAIVPYSMTISEVVSTATDLVESIKFAQISSNSWLNTVLSLGSIILPVIIFILIFKQMSGANNGALNFGKTNAKVVQQSTVRFSDVAGAEEEKEELKEIVEFLKSPKRFLNLGARIPKGVLLVGPPGTGKTLFAKAVAGEAGVPFFSISGSDFVEMFVGVGASRVRDIFDQAKKNMPCIIFIDEIDAVGRQRGTGLGGGHDEREQTLNQLLVQMDGFTKNDGIIVMAATNRADILDPALLRPGRFDRQIYVSYPDVKGREAILRVHSRNKPLGDDINFKILARMTSGFTGADIENLLNEAAILAARAKRTKIIMTDILEGINKVIAGPRKASRIITESDKRITAYHEAGHAILSKILPNCDEVQEVTIIPRGMAAGYTLTRPVTDDQHISKNKLLDQICMMLGGRAAEQIVIQDISTGASNDIERASDIARSMVTKWGMSENIGNIFLGSSREIFIGRDYQSQHNYSEELAAKIDAEIKSILDNAYSKAIEILTSNRSILDNMVRVLFEKETIYTDEVNALMDGKSYEEVLGMDSQPKPIVNDLVVPEASLKSPEDANSEPNTNTGDNQTK